jgi:cytoskeletal protein CcmA (bactofilin family)
MALWKETMAQNEQKTTASEPVEKIAPEPAPAATPVNPTPMRKESVAMAKDRQDSVFGHGVTIEGKMEGDGDVRIAGKFKGDIQIKGNLNIEKGARVTAKVNADAVTIEGEIEGTVVASAQVKLLESGQVIGDLKAKTLTVAAGSRMRGNVEFGWSESESAKVANLRPVETGKNASAV